MLFKPDKNRIAFFSFYYVWPDPGLDQKDPQWIGAWWIGYVVCAACSIAWVIPIILFPPVIRNSPSKHGTALKQDEEQMVRNDTQASSDEGNALARNGDVITMLKGILITHTSSGQCWFGGSLLMYAYWVHI